MFPITYDHIDALAASAIAKPRFCAIAIRHDVLHNLEPLKRIGPERLLSAIENRSIFTAAFLGEIDALLGRIESLIEAGTTTVECFDAEACNITGPTVWTEEHCSHRPRNSGSDGDPHRSARDTAGRA